MKALMKVAGGNDESYISGKNLILHSTRKADMDPASHGDYGLPKKHTKISFEDGYHQTVTTVPLSQAMKHPTLKSIAKSKYTLDVTPPKKPLPDPRDSQSKLRRRMEMAKAHMRVAGGR